MGITVSITPTLRPPNVAFLLPLEDLVITPRACLSPNNTPGNQRYTMSKVTVEISQCIATITFNRPETLNAIERAGQF